MDREKGSTSVSAFISACFCIALLSWLLAVFVLPHQRMNYKEANKFSELTTRISRELEAHLGIPVGSASTQIVIFGGNNIDIYVPLSAFRSVPYPHRDDFTEAVADIWCSAVDQEFLPTVQLRDIGSGDSLAKLNCVFSNTSPSFTGAYSGTVTNKTALMTAAYEIQIASSDNHIEGCMEVYRPLFGSGRIQGTTNGRTIQYTVTTPQMTIRFEGTRMGHRITGSYVVGTNPSTQQQGEFAVHKDVPNVSLPTGFALDHCPTDAYTEP
jgi:hypothetical protein